jgi:hypothetical protein
MEQEKWCSGRVLKEAQAGSHAMLSPVVPHPLSGLARYSELGGRAGELLSLHPVAAWPQVRKAYNQLKKQAAK